MGRRVARAALVGLLASAAVTGCSCSPDRGPCERDDDCAPDHVCYQDDQCLPIDVARQLGAMVGDECRRVGDRVIGCEYVCSMGFCDGPPDFAGATEAATDGDRAVMVRWSPARDQTGPDDIAYQVYVAPSSGGQDYMMPTVTVMGETSTRLEGLATGVRVYVVVRAEDARGQEDTNTHQVSAVPGCIEYATQIQPVLDERCVACHGAGEPARGVRLDMYSALMAGAGTRDLVAPCSSARSPLYLKVSAKPDLDDRDLHGGMTEEELALLAQWIDAGAVEVCPDARDTCADDQPPTFAGIDSAALLGPTEAVLCWASAADDVTGPDEMAYEVHEAIAPGGEDFDALPAAVSDPGETCVTLRGRVPGEEYCWVVRARDRAGNTDDNVAEQCVTVPAVSCIEYADVIQPMLDVRCIHCHGGDMPLRDLSLMSLDGALAGGMSGPAVQACDSGMSLLYDKISSDTPTMGVRMPGDGPPYLSPAQIDAVRQWIDEGARASCAEPDPC